MPLVNLLYRCPKCGQDPMEGSKDEALCPACRTRFSRGGEGGRIRVLESTGESWDVPSGRLTAALEALGGPESRARDAQGRLSYRASVSVKVARREEPIWFKGELQGFVELLEKGGEGVLEITDESLTLWAPKEPQEAGEAPPPLARWDLLDIRAVQTSSSSLQISPGEGGLVHFRFHQDSPRRWEDLLRLSLRKAYRKEGRGEIVEFQPRVLVL